MLAKMQRTPHAAIHQYLDRRTDAKWPVSVAEAVRLIRMVIPDCPLTDRDLADMVAIAAVEHGRCVAFDADLLGQDEERLLPA